MAEAANLVGKLEADVEIKSSAEKFHHISRTVSYRKATGEKSVQWSSGATLLASHYGVATECKDRVEEVEREKNLITFRVIKSDLLKMYKSFVSRSQVTPKHGGPGGIVHWDLEYEKVSEEVGHPESHLQLSVEVSKDIDEYLLTE
ncbi:BnaC06g43750D [Brassica napus]|uniref:BnaC06g43750D protein n=1 Tax=Brassica napus TaxID=3708 RepID=A0A078JPZ7_BRANA|nr:BnaC06g43750D [Brassica napus]